MIRLLLLLGCLLTSSVLARPSPKSTEALARYYAALHPNTDVTPNEEYGNYFEGDIEVDDDSNIVVNPLNAIRDPNRHWPSGTTYYEITNGQYTANEVSLIEAGITDLMESTRVDGELCIRILPRNDQAAFINIEKFSGCSSYVGRSGGQQRMSLVESCVNRHGTIMHEFLHAFGFYHEQSRTDRDDFVTINWDNIQAGTENNFNKYSEAVISDLGTPYDYGSVLHYSAYGFAIDPNVPTIIPHDPDALIGQRVSLSKLDIERVQIMYGCKRAEDTEYFKNYKTEELLALYG